MCVIKYRGLWFILIKITQTSKGSQVVIVMLLLFKSTLKVYFIKHACTHPTQHFINVLFFYLINTIDPWCDHSPYLTNSSSIKGLHLHIRYGAEKPLGCLLEIDCDWPANTERHAGVRRTPGGKHKSLLESTFLSYEE